MPACKICGKRIMVAKTGVRSYVCRICGRVVCREHFNLPRGVCVECFKGKRPR